MRIPLLLAIFASAAAASLAPAQVDPGSGIDFVTIRSPGNAPYAGPQLAPPWPQVTGRGSVPYEYRIARNEVSTAEWAEFVNTFSMQPNFPTHMFGLVSFTRGPSIWGAIPDFSYTGPGQRWIYSSTVGSNADLPVFGLSWRDSAMYCNWLHNGKSSDPASLHSGAYDTSTWNNFPTRPYTDQLAHSPNARYWIPTLDEWIKAAYYDPDRFGQGQEGWWTWLNSSDQPPIPGLPGTGATTSATLLQGPGTLSVYDIPLGAYPNAVSPWGLLDTASGAIEATEGANFSDFNGELLARLTAGSGAGDFSVAYSSIQRMAFPLPADRFSASVRVASAIPSPASLTACGLFLGLLSVSPRRASAT